MGTLTRRVFLRLWAAVAVAGLGLPQGSRAGERRDEIIVVDGWILRASDLPEDGR